MSEISGCTSSLNFLLLLGTISLQFLPGFSDGDSSTSKTTSGSTLALIPFGLVIWQKRKREEQYARLLKLFEEDDELELELGLRD
ncbi:hypothetical protein ACLB2K_075106 [Fragaria x ananassa]